MLASVYQLPATRLPSAVAALVRFIQVSSLITIGASKQQGK
jgi:hypothetical protein